MLSVELQKRELRKRCAAQRRQLGAIAVEAAGAAVAAHVHSMSAFHHAGRVVSYIATGNEVPTDALNVAVAQSGRPLDLPRIGKDGGFTRWQPGKPLTRGPAPAFGIDGGPAPADPAPAFYLVPLLAWDDCGRRLGRGGGFYDRALADRSPRDTVVGLGFECQRQAAVPTDPWDIPMDYIVTERRVLRCAAAPSPTPVPNLPNGVQ